MKTTGKRLARRPTRLDGDRLIAIEESDDPSSTVRALTGIGSGPADEDDYRHHLEEKNR